MSGKGRGGGWEGGRGVTPDLNKIKLIKVNVKICFLDIVGL